MTAYSTACYFARQAADLRRMRGLTVPGLVDLARPCHGAIWEFHCAKTGLVILLNARGTVNAKATKEAREEAAKAEAEEAAKAEAEEAAKAEADSVPDYRKARVVILKNGGCEIRNNDGAWIGPGLGHFRNVDSAIAWADAARPAPYVITNRDDALRLQAARDAALAKEQARARLAAYRARAGQFALPVTRPAKEQPLTLARRDATRLMAWAARLTAGAPFCAEGFRA